MDFVFHFAGRDSFSMKIKSLFAIFIIVCVAAQGTDALNFGELFSRVLNFHGSSPRAKIFAHCKLLLPIS